MKGNGVAEQEKGIDVVRFQDGIAQVLRHPMAQGYVRRHQDSDWDTL
jgi:hypothetical protein